MIEVVAIDNRHAEAELLRLATQFAQSRLFLPKQIRILTIVIEVTGAHGPAATSRAQLAAKRGLFRPAKHHFDFTVSVANGFETGVMQIMHEFVHIAQVINGRYQLAAKMVKIEGEKQPIYSGRWLGKAKGRIDDMPWQDRPWEQEAAAIGGQLSSEFMAMLHGTQTQFQAQGAKKELRLYEVGFALPEMPQIMPEQMPAQMPAQAPAMVGGEIAGDDDAGLMADIDAILAQGVAEMPAPALDDILVPSDFGAASDFSAPAPAVDFSAPQFDPGGVDAGGVDAPDVDAADMSEAVMRDKQTYVQGLDAPLTLRGDMMARKRQELQERGLLEK